MAKSVPCTLIGNTAWGYCFTPEKFNSISEAKKLQKKMLRMGIGFYTVSFGKSINASAFLK